MSTNGVNNGDDAEMADCDGEKVVTMMDVLQEQQDFEDDANAVLGASDEKNCTYSKGYIKRQAIYACLTCCIEAKTDPSKRAGVCLACSLNCHENHELIELYTKRNFRCDCGNPKFNHPCQFTADKTELNNENSYSQNFSGLYCVCSRPYPDPEATFEDEMIQCIVCEDWLHSLHLEATVPGNDQYSEMICKKCMANNEFLNDYGEFVVNIEDAKVDIGNDTRLSNGLDSEKLVNGDLGIKDNPNDVDMKDDAEKTENLDVRMNESDNTIEKNGSEIKNVSLTDTENKDDNIKAITDDTEDNRTENATDKSKISTEPQKQDTYAAIDSVTESIEENIEKSITSDEFSETVEISESKTNENDEPALTNTDTTKDINNATDQTLLEPVNATGMEIADQTEDKSNEERKESDISVNEKCTGDVDKTDNKNDVEKSETYEKPTETNNIINNDAISKEMEGDTLEKATEELSKLASDEPENCEYSETDSKDDINTNADLEAENKKETIDVVNKDNITPTDIQESIDKPDYKRKLEDTPESTSKKPKLDGCTRPKSNKIFKGATFWPANFRQKLCTCSECLTMYRDLSVMFLIDLEDTVTAYETLGKERIDGASASQYEKGLEALSSLDRVQQINALTEYNKMRDKLLDFLKSFKDRKEVVKEEDIRAFFAGMKPKREPDGVYFCR